jgi:hypothetical protein
VNGRETLSAAADGSAFDSGFPSNLLPFCGKIVYCSGVTG